MIEGVVFTALRGLVNDRCYPGMFPQQEIAPPGTVQPALPAPTWPQIRYVVIGALNEPTICGTDTVDTDDTHVQVDAVALTHGAMISLRDQVIAALQNTSPPCNRGGYFWTKDADTKTFRCVINFTFYASSPAGSP